MISYTNVRFVERGRFATVLKARHINTNEDVALKKMWVKSSLNTPHDSHQNKSISPRAHKNYFYHCVQREIKILNLLNNQQNIIKLLDTFSEDEYVIIVLELMNIDLYQLLQYMSVQKNRLSEIECVRITKQLFEGLNALHQNNIAHRDLKPANILFDKFGVLKIADLGQARIIGKHKNENIKPSDSDINGLFIRGVNITKHKKQKQICLTNEIGTRWYKSPELLYGTRKYNLLIDIWSVGCIIAEILQCQPLFCGETDIDQLCKIFHILGTINLKYYSEAIHLPDFNKIIFDEIKAKDLKLLWPLFSDRFIDLIQSCLRFNPKNRITAKDGLKHSLFELGNKCNLQTTEEFKKIIVKASIQLTQERQKKMASFNVDNDMNDEIIM